MKRTIVPPPPERPMAVRVAPLVPGLSVSDIVTELRGESASTLAVTVRPRRRS